jgi:flagellar basal-body rod modification protein FlgD
MTNVIDPNLYLSSYQGQERKTGQSNLGKDEFLRILMTQLEHQNPLKPMDDKEFIAQMATFSSLEQMVNMNETLDKFTEAQSLASQFKHSELIGKNISWQKDAGDDGSSSADQLEESKAIAIHFDKGAVRVELEDGTFVDPSQIRTVAQVVPQAEK